MLSSVEHEDFERSVLRVRQAGYRVGMFLAGDFGVAGRALVLESSGRGSGPPTLGGHSLRHLCATQPGILDLFQLAVSPEYADARWRATPSSQSKLRTTSGRFGGA
jgi:hypothetical protein